MIHDLQQNEQMMKNLFQLYRDSLPMMESVRSSIQYNERSGTENSPQPLENTLPEKPDHLNNKLSWYFNK